VTTVDGDQLAALMVQKAVGLLDSGETLDEQYFDQFEARADGAGAVKIVAETPVAPSAPPVDDLISLRALSYALHIDTKTVRSWVQRGLLQPDVGGGYTVDAGMSGLFFRRSRIDEIRRQFGLAHDPATAEDWTERFLRFARQGRLNKSYKPVMLLALLDNVSREGEISEGVLVEAFWSFYRRREALGLPPEVAASLLSRPEAASMGQVRALMVGKPLERFVIQGYLQHFPELGRVRVRPEVWEGLRYRDVLGLRLALEEQIEGYFGGIGAGAGG
jgi:hypothetical protein